jgi:hypothetical protein
MASQWIGRLVELRWMDGGEWRVIGIEAGWAQVRAVDEVAEVLAGFTPDGVVWFQKRDLLEITHQQETLT